MLSKFSLLMLIIVQLLSNEVFSQSVQSNNDKKKNREQVNKEFRRSLIDKLNQEKELIEKLLGVDIYKQFDGRFEKLLEEFDKGFYDNMQKIFEDDTFNPLFQNADQFKYGFGAVGRWSETPNLRIFTILQDFPKDAPLDIKIEKNLIKIKGVIEKKFKRRGPHGDIAQVQKMNINQQVSIPHDVMAEKASFDQKDGKTRILFPKRNAQSTSDEQEKDKPETEDKGLKPLKKRKGDVTI